MELHKKKWIELLAFLAGSRNTAHNCGECERAAVLVFSYLLSDGAMEVYETYAANRIDTAANFYQVARLAVINVLM